MMKSRHGPRCQSGAFFALPYLSPFTSFMTNERPLFLAPSLLLRQSLMGFPPLRRCHFCPLAELRNF